MNKIKEMFEAMINDPDLENNPMFKESEKFGKALDELTARIIQPSMDYANNHGDEDEGCEREDGYRRPQRWSVGYLVKAEVVYHGTLPNEVDASSLLYPHDTKGAVPFLSCLL